MKKLESKDAKFIKIIYDRFVYFAENTTTDYKRGRKFFAHDRDLNARELDLIILNYFHLYETKLKDETFEKNLGMDIGLYELLSTLHRIRGMSGAKEKVFDRLSEIHEIYLKYRG